MEATDLTLEPNEASDLAPVFDAATLERLGWDRAFLTVLDDAPAEKAMAILAHPLGAEPGTGWQAHRLKGKAGDAKKRTADAEACTRRDGWLYLVGSQFGSADGPLDPRRSWIARVREDDLAARLEGGKKPRMQIANLNFSLHRAINDVLAHASHVELARIGPVTRRRYVDETIIAGARDGSEWLPRVTSADLPVNVEAAEFRGNGRLLLGLRFPVTSDGHPLLIELEGVDAVFEDPEATLRCRNVWVLESVGSPQCPLGVRALGAQTPDVFHAVLGNLDSKGKGAALIEDNPEAASATSVHVRFKLPLTAGGGVVRTETLHEFDPIQQVEGIALADGRAHYVLDADGEIRLRTLLMA